MLPQKRRKRRAQRPPRPWIPIAIVGVAALFAVVLVVVFSNVGGSTGPNLGPISTPGPTHAAPQSGASIGQANAAVTMVEYFRFDCPHCQDFATNVEPQLERDYIKSGKLRIEFHPLALQGDILNASEAALCAGEQNHFWEYYDLVFANMARGFSISDLRTYASDLGLDTNAFNSCLDSKKYEAQVVNSTNDDLKAGVQSTPTFFIGKTATMNSLTLPYPGQTSIGGVNPSDPYTPFKTAIDKILAAP